MTPPSPNAQQEFRVALVGVTAGSLLLGRACSLAEIPLCGIYDPNPELALKASLFLGVSAQTDLDQLRQTKPTIVLASCGESIEGEALTITLSPHRLEETCRLIFSEQPEGDIPSQITSSLPELELSLEGPSEQLEAARNFLQRLPSSLRVSSTSVSS